MPAIVSGSAGAPSGTMPGVRAAGGLAIAAAEGAVKLSNERGKTVQSSGGGALEIGDASWAATVKTVAINTAGEIKATTTHRRGAQPCARCGGYRDTPWHSRRRAHGCAPLRWVV